jgi:hypothetical protein
MLEAFARGFGFAPMGLAPIPPRWARSAGASAQRGMTRWKP